MEKKEFAEIESYMLEEMDDVAHDKYHIYRVLYMALEIAKTEESVDMDILIAACLLHDIGRKKQAEDLELCHAQIGSEMAYEYLLGRGWEERRALHVKNCILSHRYRKASPPQTIEAKILFDGDKLDCVGALGLSRTFIYGGQVGEPLYELDENGEIKLDGGGAEISSFFQEYNYKIRGIYDKFYTKTASEIASKKKQASESFYESLFSEVNEIHKNGPKALDIFLYD